MLPEDLTTLINAAGRANREAAARSARDRAELTAGAEDYERQKREALPDAQMLLNWLDSGTAHELCVAMIAADLDELALGSRAICLTKQCGLRAKNFGRWMATQHHVVSTAEDLVNVAGVEAVHKVAEDIRTGLLLDRVAQQLRNTAR